MYGQEVGAGRGGSLGFFEKLRMAPASDSSWRKKTSELQVMRKAGGEAGFYLKFSYILQLRNKDDDFGVKTLWSQKSAIADFQGNARIFKDFLGSKVES